MMVAYGGRGSRFASFGALGLLGVLGALGALAVSAQTPQAGTDWLLTAAEQSRLEAGEILIDTQPEPGGSGRVRAAVRIAAPRAVVFALMTDCAQAVQFVPHLKRCAVLETAADRSWQLIEHVVDYSWYAPKTRYVFRAEYIENARVAFHHVSGDFRENEGLWELEEAATGAGPATVVKYRAHVVPRFFVPRWALRASLKRDLPALLRALRQRSETAAASAAGLSGAQASSTASSRR